MHSMVLGFAGYSLLLSSGIALIFLLRMGCIKDVLKSPLHILSMSDTLISMITSILLLINQSTPFTNFEQTFSIADANIEGTRRLLRNDGEEEYYQNQTCMRFNLNYNDSWSDGRGINGTKMNCTFQHVLMHYAMFLVPFANAFMSLLIYSLQCSSEMSCVSKRCSSLSQALENEKKDSKVWKGIGQPGPANADSNFRKRESVTQEDVNIISKHPIVDEMTQETVLAISNDKSVPTNLNNNPKYTGLGLIMQWLVPILVTVILYFSKTQDMTRLREPIEMECVFKINFPFESCNNVNSAKFESSSNLDENFVGLTIEVEDPDTLRISYPDSEAIDEVVSSVRNVVQSTLNKTCFNSTDLIYYDNSRPWNITMNNLMRQIMSDDSEMVEKLNEIRQVLYNEDFESKLRNNKCVTENSDDSAKVDQQLDDEELKLFEDVVENARIKMTSVSHQITQKPKPQDLFPMEVRTAAMSAVNMENQITLIKNNGDQIREEEEGKRDLDEINTENKTTIIKAESEMSNLNNQIYADIVERIHDTIMQVKLKGQTVNSPDNYYEENNEQSRARNIQEDRKSSSTGHRGERILNSRIYVNEKCFLSTKFLKIHLLILLFLVYFMPVLISGILQTRAIYMCKNVFEKIEAADKKNLQTSQLPNSNRVKLGDNPALKAGSFLKDSGDLVRTNLRNTQKTEEQDPRRCVQKSWQIAKDDREDDLRYKETETVFKNVLNETKSMQTLFHILTMSLLLGTLMWTPAFLEILSKVFLCASTPAWLVNVLYLLGISFGIVKNVFNINIAKIAKIINAQIYGKENTVHPSV